MCKILSFPSSRIPPVVRVERERDGRGGWLMLRDCYGESFGDFATAMAEARKIAVDFNLPICSSAGSFAP
jgi:hypothetical protein